ncbi:MAG TPA: DUF5916 domain-containing protein [Gemmatimonadaceae bacterium]|nr:DUF5916 domain-containing protein [Gemmatimonadaceae bacterium]
MPLPRPRAASAAALRLALGAAVLGATALGATVLAAQPPTTEPAGAAGSGGGRAAAASLQAVPRSGSIVLDGRLDEEAWQNAPPSPPFTQSYPNPGQPPTDSIDVRVLYDDAAIYVGARMYDAHPDSIAAQLARRDASGIYSDWLHVIIDSYHDRRTAFRFSVNPRGVQKDVYTSNDGNEDLNWDAVWEVATRVDSLGWVAEYRIPLSQLRYGSDAPAGGRVWGFQVMRDVARRNERDSFSPWTPQSPGFVSSFGLLTGLGDLPSPRRLEVLPYVSAKATREPGSSADPFYHDTDLQPSIGGDVRYGLPGGLTLTGTINPDFGQVEVDPAVVNLSAFETFFPEKRPFFLEGSDVFDFGSVRANARYGGATFLYSRRIGRAPTRAGALGFDPDIAYYDAPDQTRILGAAKITGKHGPWTVGLLNAVTAEETADILTADGVRDETPVEPLADYLAGRLRRDLRNGQTVLGAMVAGTVRDMGDDVFDPLLSRRAGFGGVDFEHAWHDREWFVSGYAAASRVDASEAVIEGLQRNSAHYYQRPDADYLDLDPARTSLTGHMVELALEKNGTWWGSLDAVESSPGFEINDVGFHGRVDYRALSGLFGYQNYQAGRHVRQRNYFVYGTSAWNFGGTSIYQGVSANANVTLNNFWSFGASAGVNPRYSSDRLTRGGPLAELPASWRGSVNVGTDSRKVVYGSAFLSYSHDESGASSTSLSLDVQARPSSSLNVSLGPTLSTQNSTSQYLRTVTDPLATATYGARYVFGDLHQTTLSLDTRIEWTLTPTLSLQTYVQPFVSAVRYERFKEFAAPRTYDFAVYGTDRGTIAYDAEARRYTVDPDGAGAAPSFTFGNPTFNSRSLRGNAVLRWQYRPGSALFLVWQQQRNDSEAIGDFDAGRDVGAIFRTVPRNVFLVKVTYWFGA